MAMIPDDFLARALPADCDEENLRLFLLSGIYESVRMTETSIQALSASDKEDQRIPMLKEKVVLNVQEFLFDSDCKPIALCNYYLKSDCYRLPLNRRAKVDLDKG